MIYTPIDLSMHDQDPYDKDVCKKRQTEKISYLHSELWSSVVHQPEVDDKGKPKGKAWQNPVQLHRDSSTASSELRGPVCESGSTCVEFCPKLFK